MIGGARDWIGLASGLALSVSLSNAQPASFTGVGDLPGGTYRSGASAVSADGRVVVGGSAGYPGFGGTQAFRWTMETGIVGLGDLPGGSSFSEANAVSPGGGYIAGHSISGNGVEAFLWNQGTGMIGLGELSGGTYQGGAAGVSQGGNVVVGNSKGENDWLQAFRWTSQDGMAGIGWLPGALSNGVRSSAARAVSADGTRIVGVSTFNDGVLSGHQAFLWTAAGMVGLGHLSEGTTYSEARAVSRDGRFVVGQSESVNGNEAFLWSQETGMIGLGDLPGSFFTSTAFGVSDDGSVVVGQGGDDSGGQAFIWRAGIGMRRLTDVLLEEHGIDTQAMGWTLVSASGVSADGLTIVGGGRNPNGSEGWVVRLPAPGAAAHLAVTALLALRRRRL